MTKMRMTTFKSIEYEKHEICIRTFGFYFEFLLVHKGKIHTAFVPVRPDLKNRVLYLLGKQELPYSEEQINAAKKLMVQIAQSTIDELISNK